MHMPPLETRRLRVRPFVMTDLAAIHQILDVELADAHTGDIGARAMEDRRRWLDWSVRNYVELANLYQPPFGDRAVVLKADNTLVGTCGYVPCLMPFGQLPALAPGGAAPEHGRASLEFGLYWAISTVHQGQGYATEAAQALIAYAFATLNLGRIVATTDYDNSASIGVMRKLGMRIERNPYPDPPWLQIVGVLEHPAAP